MRWSNLVWCLKQLLPLTYRTAYGDQRGQHFVVWRMWFGRCFDQTDVLVSGIVRDDRQLARAR